ncbi:MAG: FecR domain-containing protein [Bacteroidetes bacterium]|nr:FecR domain-containing protein [Bacteroidota bacterium]
MENLPVNDDNDDTLLARWLAGELTPEALDALRNLEGYPEYVEMLDALEGLSLPDFSPTLAWQKLASQLAVRQSAVGSGQEETVEATPEAAQTEAGKSTPIIAEIRNRKSEMRWLAIAAAVLLGVVGIWWFTGGMGEDQSIATKAGEQREVKLPDGSEATLNALSSLDFSPKTWGDDRYVLLEGEAFFKAKKGKTFTVRTEQGTVQVVGTMFNVYARDEELEVKCTEGRVQVINPESTERVLLKKGEQVTVLNGRMQDRLGLNFYPAWFKGESAFRSAPLERVFGEMERQYGVLVLTDSLGERTFSGKFVHQDLKKALKMVCDPMRLKYEVRGDTVRVF